jgi:hypothetical protein
VTRETWRLCVRDPKYLVSDQGRVRRIGRLPLKPQRNTRGYLKVTLSNRRQALVHTLVAEAFHGPRPLGHDCDHLNFDRHDNRAENLRWLRSAENAVRWGGTRSDGSILWVHRDEPLPHEDPDLHPSMTDDERAALAEDLAAAGWHDEQRTA